MIQIFANGRLTKDPVLKKTDTSGKSVCTFQIACNEGFGDNQKTLFPTFVAWEGKAEYLCKFGKKGMQVVVSGKLSERYVEHEKKKFKVTEFAVTEINLLFEKSNNNKPTQETSSTNEYAESYQPDYFQSASDTLDIPSDDLPF